MWGALVSPRENDDSNYTSYFLGGNRKKGLFVRSGTHSCDHQAKADNLKPRRAPSLFFQPPCPISTSLGRRQPGANRKEKNSPLVTVWGRQC